MPTVVATPTSPSSADAKPSSADAKKVRQPEFADDACQHRSGQNRIMIGGPPAAREVGTLQSRSSGRRDWPLFERRSARQPSFAVTGCERFMLLGFKNHNMLFVTLGAVAFVVVMVLSAVFPLSKVPITYLQ